MRKYNRPSIDRKPNNPGHWAANETIIGATHPTLRDASGAPIGCLISLRATAGSLIVEIYRADPQVRILTPEAESIDYTRDYSLTRPTY